MKEFIIFLTLFFACTNLHAKSLPVPRETTCPAENPVDHDVLLPAEDCQHFYKCNHGVPVLIPCPPNLEWCQELQRCEYPEIAQCVPGEKPVDPTKSPSTDPTKPLPTTCPAENPVDHDVLLPAEDCQHFYKCNHGVPVLLPCPPNLEWSQEYQRCDYPEVAKCTPGDHTPVVPTKPTTSQPLPTSCPAENPIDHDVLLPAEDCHHFYKCDHGVPILQTCPQGLEWSQKFERCDYPEVAKCSGGYVEPGIADQTTTMRPEVPVVAEECPKENGEYEVILGIPGNCTHFIKCDFGEAKVEMCPPGTTWDHRMQRCDFPYLSRCVPGVIPSEEKQSESIATECPAENPEDHDVFLPSEDCTKFYKCDSGVPVLQDCPKGLEWSQKLERCDYPEVAQCSGNNPDPTTEPTKEPITTTTKKPQPTEEPLPSGCPAENPEDHDVFLPSEDCTKFYKCDGGIPVLQDCPAGLEWSQKLERCEYPEVAQCSGNEPDPTTEPTKEPITTTTKKPEPTEEPLPSGCPAENPEDHDVFLPSEDCTKFYKCDSGVPVLQDCPKGLEWSQKLERCDYPEVAQCSGNNPDPTTEPTKEPITTTTNKPEPTEEPLPSGCPAENPEDHDVFLPSKDCTKFYKCDGGVPVLQDCPAGLEWSQKLERCEYPEIAQCSGDDVDPEPVEPTEEPVLKTTAEPLPTECPAENPVDHDVLLPSKDCTKFYKCDFGVPVLLDCPPGLEWSQKLQRCDYPEIAQCSA